MDDMTFKNGVLTCNLCGEKELFDKWKTVKTMADLMNITPDLQKWLDRMKAKHTPCKLK